jgi:hypothetical protein
LLWAAHPALAQFLHQWLLHFFVFFFIIVNVWYIAILVFFCVFSTVIVLTIVKNVLNFFFSFLVSWYCLCLIYVMLIPLLWIPQMCVVFVEDAKSTSMQSLVFTAPALIFVCFSISSPFCRISLPAKGAVPHVWVFFLCLVGRLDSAFRHGELVVFWIY